MSSLTLAIPDDLKAQMKRFPEINWSEVARQAIAEKTRILSGMQEVFSKSPITDAEAVKLGREVKQRVWKKYQRAK